MTEEIRDGFVTVISDGISEIKILASVFIGCAAHVSSTEDAKTLLGRVKSRYPDAAHYPFAYRLLDGSSILERQSDDREPSGTAGKPALFALQQAGMLNTGIFIARYFGGRKLGTGRLFHAFAECAAMALENAGKEFRNLTIVHRFSFPYHLTNAVNRAIADCGARVISAGYEENVSLSVELSRSRSDEFARMLKDYSGGKVALK